MRNPTIYTYIRTYGWNVDGTGLSYYIPVPLGPCGLAHTPHKCRYHILHVPSLSHITICTHTHTHTGQKRLLFELLRILAVVLVEVSADLCGESESGRHGQSDGGHFSEICTFSSEEILHLCPTVGLKTSTRFALQPKSKRGHQKPETWNLVKTRGLVKTSSFEIF